MGKKIVLEAKIFCTSCGGTGLYKGMAEKGGSAVICYQCEGTGCKTIRHEYEEFDGIKKREDITRVYETSGGYGITDKDIMSQNGVIIEFSKAGVSYDEWFRGMEPEPIKDLHCPLIHYKQGTKVGEYLKNKGICHEKLLIGCYIPKCSEENRSECWEYMRTINIEQITQGE